MKKKIIELLVTSFVGIVLAGQPVEPEREVIELPWEFAPVEEEPELVMYDIDLIAKVCQAEAGHEPFIGQVAVATTILNRCDAWGMSTSDVVYAPNQYCTSYHGTPSEDIYRAVTFAIENRDIFPSDMFYFRNKHFHTFGEPYIIIGSHYFSTAGGEE